VADEAVDRSTSILGHGVGFGLLAVSIFSATLPATRVAVAGFEPLFVTFGRVVIAALLAAALLIKRRERQPTWTEWKGLAIVAAGVVVGFPLLSAWAMVYLPASHGAIVLALLPLATAGMAVIRAGERPSSAFWWVAAVGSATVLAFTLRGGAGRLYWPDIALFGAIVAAALGYAEGGKLARSLGGWQVICWSLILALPVALPYAFLYYPWGSPPAAPAPWLGLLYVALFSQFLGFFAWYRGLHDGGIARIGQLQLLQPFLTIVISSALLGEKMGWDIIAFAGLVVALVAFGRRASVLR